MPNIVMDQDGKLFHASEAPQGKGVSYRVIATDGAEPDDSVLDSMRPGLAKEVRAMSRGGKAQEKEAEKPAPEQGEGETEGGEDKPEEKAVESEQTEDKMRSGPRSGRRG